MQRSTFLAAAAAALVVPTAAAAVAVPAAAAPSWQNKYGAFRHGTILPAAPGPVYRGCVIRIDPKGVYLHVNGAHQSVGVVPGSLRINAQGKIEFRLDVTLPVIAASADPDESLTQRGIAGGLSGGSSLCVLTLRQENQGSMQVLNLNRPADYKLAASTVSNIWVSVHSLYLG